MAQLQRLSGVVYAILSSATFGLIPLFTVPLLARGVDSSTILCYRFLLASVVVAVVMLLTKRSFRLQRGQLWVVLLLSLLYAFTAILLIQSYGYIPSGVATTIHFLYPLAVTLTMAWFFKTKTTVVTYVAVVISLVGVALLVWGSHSEGDFSRGVLLSLLSVVTYAAYIVDVMRSRASHIDSIVLTFYVLLFGAVLFFVYTLATSGIGVIGRYSDWRDLAMLAIVSTVLSDYFLILAIKRIGSTMTSILGSMEPLTAVVVGVVYFGERFDTASVVGLLLIIIAVVLVIAQTNRQSIS